MIFNNYKQKTGIVYQNNLTVIIVVDVDEQKKYFNNDLKNRMSRAAKIICNQKNYLMI